MTSCKAAKVLALFALLSFFGQNECYIGLVDSDTYKTVKHFADECVRIKPLRGFFKNKKLRKKFKKVKLFFCFASLCNQESCLCFRIRLACKSIFQRKKCNSAAGKYSVLVSTFLLNIAL